MVVQLALETISMFALYVVSFTPTTNIGASADGADITTFLAPPYTLRTILNEILVEIHICRCVYVCFSRESRITSHSRISSKVIIQK